MTATDDALKQLGTLLDEYDNYRTQRGTGRLPGGDAHTLVHRFQAAIDRLSVPGSSYARDLDRERSLRYSQTEHRLAALVGIARALRDDIAAGWLTSVVELVHVDTYAGYLEMAEGLNSQGYKDAAAVIAGTSLEVHLKSLAAKHGVGLQLPSGAPKKMDTVNAEIRAAGAYNALEHKQVTAWLGIRNYAAHGNYSDYDQAAVKGDQAAVKGLIEGVSNLAIKHPA